MFSTVLLTLALASSAALAQEGRGPGGTPCGMPFDTGCLPGYHCQSSQHHDSASCVKDGTPDFEPAGAPTPFPWLPVGGVVVLIGAIAALWVRRKRLRPPESH
jgi:hypothetical protein